MLSLLATFSAVFFGLPDPRLDPLVTSTDPDPIVRVTDPIIWIRIRTKMSRIPNTAFQLSKL
jgi:hypothetical protein